MNRKILRIIIQSILLLFTLLLPTLDLLRFDINSSQLYLFRQVWSFSREGGYVTGGFTLNHGKGSLDFLIKGVLPWFIFFISFPVWGALFGRFFCGWFCPVGTIIEWGNLLIREAKRVVKYFSVPENRRVSDFFYGLLAGFILLILLILISLSLSGFLLAPKDIIWQLTTFHFTLNFVFIFLVMTGVIIATVTFAKRLLCNFVCIFGLVQILTSIVCLISMRVLFDKKNGRRCTNCRGCERACPMELKPRLLSKMSTSCINCGECITACERELGCKDRLFHYSFGKG